MSQPPALVLASRSPRRARALRTLGVEFLVEPPDVDETRLVGESPTEMVVRLAAAKAADPEPGRIRLAVDTTVVRDGAVVGKPDEPCDAVESLLRLSGRTHEVVSGWSIVADGHSASGAVTTTVVMRPIARTEAVAYVATGEPLDKAGSYAIQGFGSRFVTTVSGSLSNVKGFPAEAIVPELIAAGIDVPRPDASLVSLRTRQ